MFLACRLAPGRLPKPASPVSMRIYGSDVEIGYILPVPLQPIVQCWNMAAKQSTSGSHGTSEACIPRKRRRNAKTFSRSSGDDCHDAAACFPYEKSRRVRATYTATYTEKLGRVCASATKLRSHFSPPSPVRAVPVSNVKYRVIVGIIEPAAKLPRIQRALAVIEDASIPVRRRAS